MGGCLQAERFVVAEESGVLLRGPLSLLCLVLVVCSRYELDMDFAFWVSFLICLSFPSLHDTPSDVRFHDLPVRQMLVDLLTLCILSCVPRHCISVGVLNSNVPLEQLPFTLCSYLLATVGFLGKTSGWNLDIARRTGVSQQFIPQSRCNELF